MKSSGSVEFDKLRDYVSANRAIVREIEFAFASLLAAANPSDRGSRFAFGGGAEWIMAAAAWSAGVLTAPQGHNADGFDLSDLLNDSRGLWSVKASASMKSSPIRLTNFMGEGKNAVWDVPTLFIGPYLGGAVFIDPRREVEIRDQVEIKKDATTLSGATVQRFGATNPQNCLIFDVAVNKGGSAGDPYAFIKSILTPKYFPLLSRPLLQAQPSSSNKRIDDIKRLVRLRDEGVLDEAQLSKAIDQTLSS